MMIPIFFPFTCISSEIVNILHTVFGQIAVYQASKKTVPKSMKDLAADGCLEIRFPVTAQEKELQTLFKQYHIWSDVHQISDKRYLIQREKAPADYTPSKIRTEIKRRLRGEPIEGKSDPVLNAGLFLVFAQQYDLQSEALHNELNTAKQLEKDFISKLRAESQDQAISPVLLSQEDTTLYMIPERVAAWCCVAQQDKETSRILVTTSQPAFEFFMDKMSKGEAVSEWGETSSNNTCSEGNSASHKNIPEYLEQLIKTPWPKKHPFLMNRSQHSEHMEIRLSIGIIPRKSPHDCYSKIVSQTSPPASTEVSNENTVLVLIAPVQ